LQPGVDVNARHAAAIKAVAALSYVREQRLLIVVIG
jgi:hypothetical protein